MHAVRLSYISIVIDFISLLHQDNEL